MKKLMKIMWMPEYSWKRCLYDMKLNEVIEAEELVGLLDDKLMEDWFKQYSVLYNSWLNSDNGDLYDLTQPVHRQVLEHLKKVNEGLADMHFYYWYDTDRSMNKSFIWETCPISEERLVSLGAGYFYNNRLVSLRYPVCLPDCNKP